MKIYKELVEMGLPSCWDKYINFIQKEAFEDIKDKMGLPFQYFFLVMHKGQDV
jgi:hypothetical protein